MVLLCIFYRSEWFVFGAGSDLRRARASLFSFSASFLKRFDFFVAVRPRITKRYARKI